MTTHRKGEIHEPSPFIAPNAVAKPRPLLIGQLKTLFSQHFTHDANGDGLPDLWKQRLCKHRHLCVDSICGWSRHEGLFRFELNLARTTVADHSRSIIMSFLDRLLGKAPAHPADPTLDWPDGGAVDLVLVPHEGRLGELRFGAAIDQARPWGKPAGSRWIQKNYLELVYARSGFQVDFEDGRLAYLAFFMNRHVAEPDIKGGYEFATVNLQLAGGRQGQLTGASTREVIEAYFGPPADVDVDDDEIVLTYELSGTTLEFEIHPKDKTLMRLNVYPSGG